MPVILQPSDYQGSQIVWLLEISWSGTVQRFSTIPLTLTDADGREISYLRGMPEPDWSNNYDRLVTTPSGSSVTTELIFDARVDPVRMQAQGRRLDAATGALFYILLREGESLQSFEDRFFVFDGKVTLPQFGDPDKPLGWAAFTLRGYSYEDRAVFIEATAKVQRVTWPTGHPKIEGAIYPYPIGRPGRFINEDGLLDDGAGIEYSHGGSPGLPVETYTYSVLGDFFGQLVSQTLLISGAPVLAEKVLIFDSEGAYGEYDVTHQSDGRGRTVATVQIWDASDDIAYNLDPDNKTLYPIKFLDETEFWVAFHDPSGGGIHSPYRFGTLEGAGDVISFMLEGSSLQVNRPAWRSARAALNRLMRVDAYINDPEISPWKWLQNLLPLLGISVIKGPRGLEPVLSTTLQRRLPQLTTITEGTGFQLIGPVTSEVDPSDVITQVTMEGMPDNIDSGGYFEIFSYGSEFESDADIAPFRPLKAAAGRYGLRNVLSEATELTWDKRSLGLMAQRMGRDGASSPWTVAAWAAPKFGVLKLGRQFLLNAPSIGVSQQIVTLYSIAWEGSGWRLALVAETNPITDDRSLAYSG